MSIRRESNGKTSSVAKGLAVGALVSASITVISTAILAVMIDKEMISWDRVGYGVLIMVMLSAFMGGVVAYKKIKRQRLMICLMSGFIYFGMLLSITAMFFGGQYEAVGVTAILIAGGSFCAALPGIGQNSSLTRSKIKKYYR